MKKYSEILKVQNGQLLHYKISNTSLKLMNSLGV